MDPKTRLAGYDFGEFRVDPQRRMLLVKTSGRPLPLTSKAFDLLLFFIEHPGQLLDKSKLMAAVWPNVVVEENNLNQHVSTLRRLLGEHPEERRFIVTVPGRGYQFIAAVQPVMAAATGAPPESPRLPGEAPPFLAEKPILAPTDAADSTGPRSMQAAPAQIAVESSRRRPILWALGVALLLAVTVWYVARRVVSLTSHGKPASIEIVAVRPPRVAVLPFENLSPDPNNAFFADGLHEEILSTLAARVRGIEVISRTTMMSYRTSPPKPLAVVARELNASHLIEGSVRREGSRIRLTLQLIDARTDAQIWSSSYDRTLADALALETQVAEQIAGQLAAQLTPAESAEPMRDSEAFDLYLKAVLALRTFTGEEDRATFHQIESSLSRVIQRQPGFAMAYVQRARIRTIWFYSGGDTSDAFLSAIRADLDAAQHLAPQNAFVLAAMALYRMFTNDTSGALDAYAKAERAGLGTPEWLIPKAYLLLRRSRIEELDAALQQMLSLDPANPITIRAAAYSFHQARQPLDALHAAEYARSAFPPLCEIFRGYVLNDFAGSTTELRSFIERYEPSTDPALFTDSLQDYFIVLRYEHRYAELRAHIDHAREESARYYGGPDLGPVGPTPTALFRGWADLLLADRAAAMRDGRAVLSFIGRQPRTRWNAGYLEMLTADGRTFMGDCERAQAAGKSALGMVARADDALVWNERALELARVDAWCGAREDAVALLRELSSSRPGVGPTSITRDPLFTIPLAGTPSFRTLSYQLEGTRLPVGTAASGAQ